MKTANSNDQPAFPQCGFSDGDNSFSSKDLGGPGMTIRDFFAAHALTGLLAQGPVESEVSAAMAAYRYADEMINIRQP